MKDRPLTVQIEEEELVLRIGVDTLAWACEHCPKLEDDWFDPTYKVTDPAGFARDVLRELEREEEDGTTAVHVLLDAVIVEAIDRGSCAVEESASDPAGGSERVENTGQKGD
jgi:hypothetical protein